MSVWSIQMASFPEAHCLSDIHCIHEEENMKNSPEIQSERLILRKFTETDLPALYLIFQDKDVNQFLPWYPLDSPEQARSFFEQRYASQYVQNQSYAYAICLKEDNVPIGYIELSMKEPYELGYGLKKEFWHQKIITEAALALIQQLKADHFPYFIATHDVRNPRSGGVMQQIGMKYQYSYEEIVQPKNQRILFRLYLLNLDGHHDRQVAHF